MIKQISEELLRENAKKLELAFLLPTLYGDTAFDLQVKLLSRWHGRDIEGTLLNTLGLAAGGTICTDVELCFSNNVIPEGTQFTLFADADTASKLIKCGTTIGDTVVGHVELLYTPLRANLVLKSLYSVTRNTMRQQVCIYNAEGQK